jgi:hypothetical protein
MRSLSTVILASPPQPVEVLHNGAWVTGWLEAYRRERDGWRAMVRFSPSPGAPYLQWRPAEQLRQRER